MKEFNVTIIETLKRTVTVEAEDFSGVEFETQEDNTEAEIETG
ncbi:DpnD/PcfM family protein [Ruminococcus albus]|nr:hypothetical protein [Ruminococcus albus]